MEIQSAFNAGLQGFQKATEQANKAAENIVANTVTISDENSEASATVSDSKIPDLNQSLVDLKVAEYQAKSSTQVIESADESLGTLLDVTA